jgi:thioesterase domain-containing protein
VPIQTGGARPPLFCVHGAGGNVVNFRDLARSLGADVPFYGLQARGVDGKHAPTTRIEEMATEYIAAVRTVQPHGPYYLAGYSGGGVIAFEMAQQLRRQGEPVATVALLDTFSPTLSAPEYDNHDRLRRLRQDGPRLLLSWPRRFVERQALRLSQMRIRWHARRGQPVPHQLRDLQMTMAYLEAQQHYQPEPYPGRLTLFRAAEIAPIYQYAGPELGWTGLSHDPVDVRQVPGGHDNLVLEPNVRILASALRACLEEAKVTV